MVRRMLSVMFILMLFSGASRAVAAEVPDTMTIELQNPGDEPRRELRYDFEPGDKQTMIVTTTMNMSTEMNGRPAPSPAMPRQRMEIACAVDGVTEDGNLKCSFEVTEVDIVDDAENPSPIAGQVREMIKTMVGMSGSYVQTRQGKVLNFEVRYPEGINPMMRQSMAGMEQMMSQNAVPLPREAVGVGAVWTVNQPLDTPMFKFVQRATYTVTQLEEDNVSMDMKIEQSAPAQDLNMQGATMRLTEYQGEGEGEMTLHFARLVPTARTSVTTTNTIEGSNAGQPISVRTNMLMDVRIEPKE